MEKVRVVFFKFMYGLHQLPSEHDSFVVCQVMLFIRVHVLRLLSFRGLILRSGFLVGGHRAHQVYF